MRGKVHTVDVGSYESNTSVNEGFNDLRFETGKEGHLMMWRYGYTFSWPGMFIMLAIGVILCIALIVGIVWLFMRASGRKNSVPVMPRASSLSSMDILEQRYARGELDPQTCEQMREQLQKDMSGQLVQ